MNSRSPIQAINAHHNDRHISLVMLYRSHTTLFMNSYPRVLAAAAAAAILFFSGCTTDDPASPNPSAGGNMEAMLPLSYSYVRDSDGGRAKDGVEVMLLFEANGVAQLYVAGEDDAIAYRGSYTYAGGTLALKFTDADFSHDVTVGLDTAQGTLSLPFKLFSDGSGTSAWEKKRFLPHHNFSAIFKAALINESLSIDAALDRVMAYAHAIINTGRAAKRSLALAAAGDPVLTAIEKTPNGVKVQYNNGPWNYILLYSWPVGANTAPLQPGPLASDPRVHLDPQSPSSGVSDPPNKTALFIAPFKSLRFFSWLDLGRSGVGMQPAEGYHYSGSENFDFDAMASLLSKRDYQVQQIMNDDASITAMARALTAGSSAPGFIVINTHGHSDGSLTSGVFLGATQTITNVNLADFPPYVKERDELTAAGFGDLLTYDGGTADAPKTLAWTAIERDLRPGTYSYYLTITPKFWEWLRTRKGVKFDHSLLYIASCLTDASANLRDAVQARAHFAFNIPVRPELAGATFQYLCRSLSRPSHSAEESYYNIIRIATTRQMIYAEDNLFSGLTSPDGRNQQTTLKDIFNGYTFDGNNMVSYQSGGWLKTTGADPGSIWWLLFSGRWGQNAQEGADGMRSCWQSFWKDGNTGGLASPACQNKAPGRAPTEAEVAYASYLLTGMPVLGDGSMTRLPRWTLNDGR